MKQVKQGGQQRKQKSLLYAFVVFTLLAASLQMILLSKFSFDEYFTINLVRNSWADVIRLTALDVHPPLYYLAVKAAVTILGENFFSWHLVSFLCFLALLYITERFVSRLFGEREACIAVLAFCAVPNMLRYALQVRMYSMAVLFVTAAFYLTWSLAQRYEEKPGRGSLKYWVLLGLVNVAAAYTHYFAGVAAVGISLFLLVYLLAVKKDFRHTVPQWCLYCAAMAVLYLPWLFVMLRQMSSISGGYWIAPLNLNTLYGYLDILFAMSKEPLQYGLVIAFFLGCFYAVVKKDRSERELWVWGGFFAAGFFLLFGVGYSVLRTPILIDRYLVILVPMLWMPVLISLAERREKWIEVGLVLLLCLCFLVNRNDLYNEYAAVQNEEETQCLLQHVGAEDVMYHTNVQRLAERAAFLPDTRHLLLEGVDEGEAFHYWTEMIGCEEVQDTAEVIALVEAQCGGNTAVWCEDDTCLETFVEAGWQVEEYPAWSVVFYRLSRP